MKIDERILVWKFNRGSKEALQLLYEKYKDDLLGLAITLLRDRSLAEDVVHDVFVSFAGQAGTFRLSGTLKGYLSTCVANASRDKNRLKSRLDVNLEAAQETDSSLSGPMECAVNSEETRQAQQGLDRLPYEQREIIVLHLHQEMRFRHIAQTLGLSINTVQSRYRYGLDKLRSMLNGKVTR